jgi:hypothetical protein
VKAIFHSEIKDNNLIVAGAIPYLAGEKPGQCAYGGGFLCLV